MSVSGRRIAELAQEAADAADAAQALRVLSDLRHVLEEYERQQVAAALTEGRSYADVAQALGITRQAANRRFRDLAPQKGRGPRRKRLPVTPEVRMVFAYARGEALALRAESLQPEHVLLGILRNDDRRAAAALNAGGVTLDGARLETLRPASRLDRDGATAVRAALARAGRRADEEGAEHIGVDHLLRGVLGELREIDVPAADVIRALDRAAAGAPAAPGASAREPRFSPRS